MKTEQIPARDRIVFATAELLRHRGYAATGMKQIVEDANAPFGSIYHYFPGGKEELADETVRRGGEFFLALLMIYLEDYPDPAEAISEFFDGAAGTLERTGYADACPIATLALEVANTNERLRRTTAAAFDSWLVPLVTRFTDAGIRAKAAEDLATATLAALEGGFILSRAKRSTQPMAAARDLAVGAVERALG